MKAERTDPGQQEVHRRPGRRDQPAGLGAEIQCASRAYPGELLLCEWFVRSQVAKPFGEQLDILGAPPRSFPWQ